MTSQTSDKDGDVVCMPLTEYGQSSDLPEGYENYRTFSDDDGDAEIYEESEKRNRKAPERYSDPQCVRIIGVQNMSVEFSLLG